jgi:hypothetical protein
MFLLRGVLTPDMCPVPIEIVELYLQILRPAFDLSIGWQSNTSSICEVVIGYLEYNILHAVYLFCKLNIIF